MVIFTANRIERYMEVFLSLGSNEGDRMGMLCSAIEEINRQYGPIIKISSIYETEAWGNKDQEAFLNQVLSVNIDEDPAETMRKLLEIESKLGRVRREKWGSRKIDIDILFFGEIILKEKELCIPHDRIGERLFILIPLNEIAPNFRHPAQGLLIRELLSKCSDTCAVKKFKS